MFAIQNKKAETLEWLTKAVGMEYRPAEVMGPDFGFLFKDPEFQSACIPPGAQAIDVLSLSDLTWSSRRWSESGAYADSKLHNVILACAVARKWPDILSNTVDPGWVATKMGGREAPVSIEEGARTQVWLAVNQEKEALVSGRYFSHQPPRSFHPAAAAPAVQ